ncbi:unnamed protein product, partial [marine sediment metagenome]
LLNRESLVPTENQDPRSWKYHGKKLLWLFHIRYRAKNVQMKLGLEGGYFEDRVREGEDYYFWGGGCEVEIRF